MCVLLWCRGFDSASCPSIPRGTMVRSSLFSGQARRRIFPSVELFLGFSCFAFGAVSCLSPIYVQQDLAPTPELARHMRH